MRRTTSLGRRTANLSAFSRAQDHLREQTAHGAIGGAGLGSPIACVQGRWPGPWQALDRPECVLFCCCSSQ